MLALLLHNYFLMKGYQMKKILMLSVLFSLAVFAQVPIPETGCYHSAFTGDDSQASFESLAGKNIAIEMFFTGWPNNTVPDFPAAKCTQIDNNGAVPHITWMPQVPGTPYPLNSILNGSYDSYINGYATQVKNWGKPLFIRLGHEFNGDWYTYGGANNGGGTLTGFGDPTKADGPERFIAAYQRVHDLFEAQNADNVVWVWCPNNGSSPNEAWNVPEAYYPGDSYVDWIGFDGYNFGTTQTWSNWITFFNAFNTLYHKFKDYGKPIMLGEFACVEQGGTKSQWITDAYLTWLKFGYPKIKAATWFHVAKTEGTVYTDWRINSSAASLAAYQNAIADPYFLAAVPVTDVQNEEAIPQDFSLGQNYPNPFNPSTRISWKCPVGSWQILKVYDVLGNEVATLVNEYRPAGSYEIEFNIGSSFKNLASGIYFYRLQAGEFAVTKKMILQK
ncbi:MAG TPA: hypothetical protein DHV28_08870 [Ignavibacteriales bacterium]|nr:hypothetical protein [Ignavibacteriales bacterium]